MKIKFDMDPKELVGIVEAVMSYGKKELKARRADRRLEAMKLEQKTNTTELMEMNKKLMEKVNDLDTEIRRMKIENSVKETKK